MKKHIITLVACIAFGTLSFAQNQIANLEGINYQAVAIDEKGQEIVGADIHGKPLFEKEIGVRFSITDGPTSSTIYYQDEHVTNTDKYGLFSLTIGLGNNTMVGAYNTLLDIPWINGDQWLMVEISTQNDGVYKQVSYEKFMAVPFAFYTDDISDNSITTFKIVDSTILNIDIATGSVDSRTILDSTILNIDIATGSVDSRTILDSTILNIDIATGSVDTRTILDSTILNEDIATGSVDSRTILDETILAEDIATGAVTTDEILNGTILNEDISNGTIDLTTKVTGILPVPNGGTGASSLTDGGLLIGSGTNSVTALPQAIDMQIPVGVTASDPVLKLLAAGSGITIINTADSVIITSSITGGVNADGTLDLGSFSVPVGETYIAGPFVIPGTGTLGDILLGSVNVNLQGCMMTTYYSTGNTGYIAIFNGTNSPKNFGSVIAKVLAVK